MQRLPVVAGETSPVAIEAAAMIKLPMPDARGNGEGAGVDGEESVWPVPVMRRISNRDNRRPHTRRSHAGATGNRTAPFTFEWVTQQRGQKKLNLLITSE